MSSSLLSGPQRNSIAADGEKKDPESLIRFQKLRIGGHADEPPLGLARPEGQAVIVSMLILKKDHYPVIMEEMTVYT
jgi:hypothetical protein